MKTRRNLGLAWGSQQTVMQVLTYVKERRNSGKGLESLSQSQPERTPVISYGVLFEHPWSAESWAGSLLMWPKADGFGKYWSPQSITVSAGGDLRDTFLELPGWCIHCPCVIESYVIWMSSSFIKYVCTYLSCNLQHGRHVSQSIMNSTGFIAQVWDYLS